jgi:hypothetical protein
MGLNKLVAFSCMSLTLILVWAGPAKADSFSSGQFVTYTEGEWSSGGVAASLLTADYDSVYQGTAGDLIVGVTGTPGQFFLELDSSGAVLGLVPTSGQAGALTANLLDPTSSPSGVFGGDVVALALNVDFSNAGLLGTSSVPFGDLVLTNMGNFNLSSLNGVTVNQFLADANVCLGGGACPLTDRPELGFSPLDFTNDLTVQLQVSFEGGTPDAFADDNLELPSSTTPAPEPSSFLLLAPALAGLGLLRRLLQT